MSVESTVRAVTTYRLTEMKQRGEKIAMLTSYDYSMAKRSSNRSTASFRPEYPSWGTWG